MMYNYYFTETNTTPEWYTAERYDYCDAFVSEKKHTFIAPLFKRISMFLF